MSMIDCKVHVEKKPDPNGDRVVLSFECVLLASLLMCPTSRVLIVGNSCHMLDGERGFNRLSLVVEISHTTSLAFSKGAPPLATKQPLRQRR